MSLFGLQINFEKSKFPRNWNNEITKIIGETFPASNNKISGTLVDNTNILWQGTMDNAIIISIQTIENVEKRLNQKCIAALTKYLSEETDVPPSRIFVNLMEKVCSDMAIDGLLL